MDGFLIRIGQLAVFLICAQTLIHFRANDSYEKYMKLLVSMILLILLLEPFGTFFHGDVTEELTDRIQVYESKLQDIMTHSQLQGDEIEAILQNITEKQVQEGMEYAKTEESPSEEYVNTEGSIEPIEVETVIVGNSQLGGNDGKSAESP